MVQSYVGHVCERFEVVVNVGAIALRVGALKGEAAGFRLGACRELTS